MIVKRAPDEVPGDRTAWLTELSQEPHVLQHCVLGPKLFLTRRFHTGEFAPRLQRQLAIQVHPVLTCWIGLHLALLLSLLF